MKIIPIKIPNKLASKPCFVDDEDYELVKEFPWCAKGVSEWSKYTLYALNRIHGRMHRFIMNPQKVMVVDHIDGNGLNNCRSNLRICTKDENIRNQRKRSNNTTGFKGVYIDKRTGKFCAGIAVNNKSTYLGSFETAVEAAKAYDDASLRFHGEFAKPNGV